MITEYQMSTPEAVPIGYGLAGIGSRFLAALIDFIIILFAIILIGLGALGLASIGGSAFSRCRRDFFRHGFKPVVLGLHIVFETMWEGQSPGKHAIGLRVLKTSGMPVGFLDASHS